MSRPVLKQTPEERKARLREAQRAYNSRERDAFHAFRDTQGRDSVRNQKAFRSLMREKDWALPAHGGPNSRPVSDKREERVRKFVEEGLGRDYSSEEFDRRYNRNR